MKTSRKRRPGNQISLFLKLGALLAMPWALAGCLTDYDDHSSNGVSLSQAMQASASGSREPLHGNSSSETHTSVDVDVNANTSTSTSSGGSGGGVVIMGVSPGDSDFR